MSKEKSLLSSMTGGQGQPMRVSVGESPYWGHFRTFRVKGGFLCGVCRNTYEHESQAKACVSGCVQPYAKSKVDILVRGMKTRYRCPFCYREYLDSNDALGCLARCKKHIFSETGCEPYKDAMENDLAMIRGKVTGFASAMPGRASGLTNRNDRPVLSEIAAREPARGNNVTAPQAHLKVVAPGPTQQHGAARTSSQGGTINMAKPAQKMAAATPQPAQAQKAVIPVFTEAVAAPAPVEAAPVAETYDPNMIYREEGQKPFSRDNARYVCSACHQKFFTKTEVENCFQTHPLKPNV